MEGVFVSREDPSFSVSSRDSSLAMGASEDDFCLTSPPPFVLDKYDGFIGSVRKPPVVRCTNS